MRAFLIRLAIAFVIALFLPFPGPHISDYVPVVATIARRDVLDADPAFFLIIGGAILIYTFVMLGVIVLLEWAVRQMAKA
jgi:hypothetical protein